MFDKMTHNKNTLFKWFGKWWQFGWKRVFALYAASVDKIIIEIAMTGKSNFLSFVCISINIKNINYEVKKM